MKTFIKGGTVSLKTFLAQNILVTKNVKRYVQKYAKLAY